MTAKSKNACSACGTSPVNHSLLFILSFLEETIGRPIDKVFTFSKKNNYKRVADIVEKILFTVSSIIGIVRFDTNLEKATTGRSKLIWEEATRRSIPMEQIVIFGKHVELYRAIINGRRYYFQSLPIPPWLHQSGYTWLDDKFKLYKELLKADISAPGARKIFSWKSALNAFSVLKKPVIIKPRNGSRGRHTTTNIKTDEELRHAIAVVRKITLWSVMQEHLFGSVYRATVINNELVGFFRADSPQVTGNGNDAIRELIEEKNENRDERLSEIIINDDLTNFLKRQNYNVESILEKDKTINLSAKTGRMYGGSTEEMLPNVHPKMHEIF
ncbi:MAG: hypothetical protein Q8Q91_02330, partial [Candidatus Daviesbacteria bacterium]|nr:hypothetical protein [Candidatus Daviesbacteria bacterium]